MSMLKQVIKLGEFAAVLIMSALMIVYMPVGTKRVEAASSDVVYIPDAVVKAGLNNALRIADETANITQGQLQSVTEVNLGNSSEKVTSLTGLEYCTNLEKLTIYTDSETLDLSVLSKFSKLTDLSFFGPKIKDVSQINVCKKLDFLSLNVTNLTALPTVSTITFLNVNTNGTETTLDLSALRSMTNLTKLRLTNVKSNDYTPVSALTKLKSLEISYSDITSAPKLSAMTGLEEISLFNCRELTDISGLANITGAKTLNFKHDVILEDVTAIADLKNVEYLCLRDTNIFDNEQYIQANMNAIKGLTKMTELELAYTSMTDAQGSMLSAMNSLETLILGYTDITNLSFLSMHADNLKELTVYGTDVNNDSINILKQMKNLEILGIGRTDITDFSFISSLPLLTDNCISFSDWGSSGTQTFSRVEMDVPDTVTYVTVQNDVKNHTGAIVAPVQSTAYTYNAAANTITVPIDMTSTKNSVAVEYVLNMKSQSGEELLAKHKKTIAVTRKESLKITEPPKDVTIMEDTDSGMSVTAKGVGTLTYQWYKDGVALAGETESTIRFTDAELSDSGSYTVKVTDSFYNQVVTSKAATLSVLPKPLEITGTVSTSNTTTNKTVTIIGTADGGNRGYTYKYLVYNTTTKTWTALTSYISANTYKWTPKEAGTYKVYVEVKDSDGTVVRSNAKSVTVKYPELKVTASAGSATVPSGQKLTFTGKATGGSGNYTYSYLIYNKTTGAWARLTPEFVASNTYTWTAGVEGNRAIYVEVKDSNGTVVRSSAIHVTVTQKLLSVTAKASLSSVCTGNKVRITATATGGSEEYTYKYLIYNATTNAWASLTSGYIKEKSFVWTAGSIGNRKIYVEVKDSDGNVVRSSAVQVEVTPQPLKVSGKSSATSVMKGNKVTISATATGGVEGYTYSYLVYNTKTNEWGRLTSFTKKSSFTWTAGSLGDRKFYVEVKDSTGAVVRSSAIEVKVTPQPLKVVVKSSATTVAAGNKVTIAATATGGSEEYTYYFQIRNMETGAWSRLTSGFVTGRTFVWTAGSVGMREIYVDVRDSAGNTVKSSATTITVK